jgi:hypothetical protein
MTGFIEVLPADQLVLSTGANTISSCLTPDQIGEITHQATVLAQQSLIIGLIVGAIIGYGAAFAYISLKIEAEKRENQ